MTAVGSGRDRTAGGHEGHDGCWQKQQGLKEWQMWAGSAVGAGSPSGQQRAPVSATKGSQSSAYVNDSGACGMYLGECTELMFNSFSQEYLICAMTIWPCCSHAVLRSMVLRFGSCGERIWRGRKQQGSAERLLRSTEQQEQGARDGSGRVPTTITELDRGAGVMFYLIDF
uniref:Uncharacterized protein n=1 Tax=Aegilops tauschii subsp. strangulata TaxID=200361 RepID=A0A453JWU2_AEGTS